MEKNYLPVKIVRYLHKPFLALAILLLCSAQSAVSDSTLSAKKTTSIPAKTSVSKSKTPGFLTRAKRVFFSTKPKPQPPAQQQTKTATVTKPESDKILSDVKVYPNPITTDQINLSYSLRRDANITIRIMDVLGNPLVTLLQQRLPAGNQLNTFSLNNKLTSGFYFIRVTIGTESIIKRISIL